MPFTFDESVDFGTGTALTALIAELLDSSGTVVASTAFSGFVDIGGGSGRQFGFALTAPDGFTRGFERVRDLNAVERSLVDSVNLLFGQASVILAAGGAPSLVLPGDSVTV